MRSTWKRLSRRILPAALTAALLLQPVMAANQPTAPEGWRSPFSDVAEGDWFYPFVASLNSQGVINGYDDGRFGPNDATRAGDSMIMVLKAAGSGTLEPLQDAHYAAAYAQYAVAQGWLTQEQVPSDLNGTIPRLFIAQLAAKALGLTPTEGASPFADTDDGCVTALYQEGMLAGSVEDGRLVFKPEDPITRAEVSAIIWQVQEYAAQQNAAEPEGPAEPETPEEPEEPAEFIQFGTHTLEILDGVPVNPYNPQAFVLEDGRMTYASDGVEAVLGIDVSSFQGTIDWEKVADDGVQFAVIRAGGRYYGSGVIFEDTRFRANIQGALDAGLEVGVYFFSQAISAAEAREEADFLLDLLEDYDITGPVVFDWENIANTSARTDGLDSATLTAAANAFCRRVEKAGYQPMIYFNQYIAYLLYDLEGITQYPLWLAQYTETPTFYYGFQMWQYTDTGRVDGINGPVDMNLSFLPAGGQLPEQPEQPEKTVNPGASQDIRM